jgi:hypothetical protein
MSLSVTTQQFAGGVSQYDDPEAVGVSNYLYWLCGKFQLEGQQIINGVGGGTVIGLPINAGVSTPNPLDFEVTANSPISTGVSTITISNYIGYNVIFVRGGITQSSIDLGGGSYYSWNRVTGQFTCFPAAQAGELFQLYPQ